MIVKVDLSQTLIVRDDGRNDEKREQLISQKHYEVKSYYALIHKVLNDMEHKGFDLHSCQLFFNNDTISESRGSDNSQLIHLFTSHDVWKENGWR